MSSKLNDKQIEAITSENKFVVIIAGAGSGKTTVLTKRISYLYQKKNVDPKSILAITFTNKATNEMKERLTKSDGPYAQMTSIMTFHGFAVRILRDNGSHLKNHNNNFKIIDLEDQKKIIKNIIKDNNLNEEHSVKNVYNTISYAKTFASSLNEVEYKVEFEYLNIFKLYRKFCIENNLFDFDDLLLYAHDLLKKKEIAMHYKKKYKHILVDEFQDTSPIQFDILKRITSNETVMFIVGDVDQSIYSWRGATVNNMLNLQKLSEVKLIKLEQNYRSNKEILLLANNLISYNEERIDKNLWTEKDGHSDIEYFDCNSASIESEIVKDKVNALIDNGNSLHEIAVLYRSNYQSRKIEEVLVKNHIPYTIYGGIRFYERMEIKDIISYLRIIIDNSDIIALERVINVPKRKIGEKTIYKYKTYANENNITLFSAIKEIGSKAALEFVNIVESYSHKIEMNFEENFNELLNDIGYYDYLDAYDNTTYDDRVANINELKESIINSLENNNLNEYLNDLAIYSEKDDAVNDRIILSTVHGVKGLEFESVFLIGFNQGKFPLERTLELKDELEEERRLAYVAITRAKNNLYISSTKFNFKGEFMEPSIFLKEMEIQMNQKDDFFDFFI